MSNSDQQPSPRARRGLEYFESLQYLEGRKFTPLETASRLLEALGNPQNAVPAIHVAGTNGKGTVCALLASILRGAKKNVGQTSSPHLSDVTERCLINGAPVSAEEFGSAIEHVVDTAERCGLAPSYFVLGLIAAFHTFATRRLDWAVVEVGLGGRYDATNLIMRPAATVITSISADHTDVLGAELSQIAWNKVGIAKYGVPMFVARLPDEARTVVAQGVEQVGASVEFMDEHFSYSSATDELIIAAERKPAFLRLLRLPGKHQLENAALAVRTAYALGVSESAIREGVERARWPGRLEMIRVAAPGERSVDVLMDVAHNPGGVEALKAYLPTLVPGQYDRVTFLVSILGRKAWEEMVSQLSDLGLEARVDFVFTTSGHPDSVEPQRLVAQLDGATAEPDCEYALRSLIAAAEPRRLVVITGSVFLVGKLRPLLTAGPIATIAGSSD